MNGQLDFHNAASAHREHGITAGGGTDMYPAMEKAYLALRDYKKADGELGYFQHHFAVYDRADEPCPNKSCGGKIKRIVQRGRSTFYCPKCQK